MKAGDGLGGGGGGQGAVDEFDEELRGAAERGDFVVPAAQKMVRPGVVRIEGEGALGFLFHEAGVGDFGAGVAAEAERAVADGEGENADGVFGIEGDGALGVGECLGCTAFFLGDGIGGEIDDGVGVLAGDFLEDEGVVGFRGVSLEEEVKGFGGIEVLLGGETFADERICVGCTSGGEREEEGED